MFEKEKKEIAYDCGCVRSRPKTSKTQPESKPKLASNKKELALAVRKLEPETAIRSRERCRGGKSAALETVPLGGYFVFPSSIIPFANMSRF